MSAQPALAPTLDTFPAKRHLSLVSDSTQRRVYENGEHMIASSPDWPTTLERFRAFQIAAGLGERTIDGREAVLNALAIRTEKRPHAIRHDDLIDFLGRPHARTGRELSPGTKQVERSYLQVWGRWAHEEAIIDHDPARRLPKVRMPRRRARPLHFEHIAAMLAKDHLWQSTLDLITIAANSGLRIGEIVKIHGRDYDPYTNELYSLRKAGFVQYIKLSPVLIEMAQRMPRDGWWFPSQYPNKQFPNGGGHILMKSASTRITSVMRSVGITDVRLTGHSIRHFYCCLLLSTGTPVHVVQEMMGHASLATTQLYTEVPEHEMQAAILRLPWIAPGPDPSEVLEPLDLLAA